MSQILSFATYLESKSKLYEALKRDPIHEATYRVNKYCRIVVGENKVDREYINLKPKQIINIKWKYVDIDGIPEPVSIQIPHLNESTNDTNTFPTFQTGERLLTWIHNNAREM
jgi:hypothetical protein